MHACVRTLTHTKTNLQTAHYYGYRVQTLEEVQALGRAAPSPPVPPKPEDLCTIMYTSGTTGACCVWTACAP